MRRLFILALCMFSMSLFSQSLEGRWKTGDFIIKIMKYENDNSKFKIIVYEDGNAYTYVETKRVLTWDNGVQRKYKLYASSTSYSSYLPRNMEINFSESSRPTEIFGMNLGSVSYSVSRIDNQKSSSTPTYSFRDGVKKYNEQNVQQTVNQNNTHQSNVYGDNNNSTTNVNGNNNQTIIINNYNR